MEHVGNIIFHSLYESPIEQILDNSLMKLGLKTEIQHIVGVFRLDISFPEIKLAIECDGYKYHSGENKIQQDKYRQKRLEELGWKFERFQGWLIKRFPDVCAAKIGLKYFKNQMTLENVKNAEKAIELFNLRIKS